MTGAEGVAIVPEDECSNCNTSFHPRVPSQELPERGAAVAVLCFFFRAQFGEGFLNLWKVEKGIIPEAIRPTGVRQNRAFGLSTKYFQDLAVACGGNHAYESASALALRNI